MAQVDPPFQKELLAQRVGRTPSPCDGCGTRSHSFCDALEGPEFDRLAAIVTGRTFVARQTVVQEGDPAEWLFNILSGTLKLYRTLPDGRVQVLGFLSEGDFVGLPASANYTVGAEAVTDVEACAFPRRSFDRLVNDSPALERRLFELARSEIDAARDHMLLLGRKTAREKVASFLVSMALRPRRALTPTPCVMLPMARSEIADFLGLTMETVSRTFTILREQGVISLDTADRVLLKGFDTLKQIAAGED